MYVALLPVKKFFWYGSIEQNMEENFSLEWNMEWKILSMEWKKITGMEYGKIIFHSIPFHIMLCCKVPSCD